jgi:uncharacterized protein (TIGR00162 family)
MSSWKMLKVGTSPKLHNPLFIEGLPGIGNVGKVAVDFMIDELHATKLYEITSSSFPHSVFVNEKNLVELPTVEVYYKKLKKRDVLLMSGDVQPIDEAGCYQFSNNTLDVLEKHGSKELITLGGIGLSDIPKKPKVFMTGNNDAIVSQYKKEMRGLAENSLYGVVGPIVGVSGLLVGLASQRNISAVCMLAETYGHPMYLGIKGARELLRALDQKLSLNLNVKKLEKEIKEIETEIKKTELQDISKSGTFVKGATQEISYIG